MTFSLYQDDLDHIVQKTQMVWNELDNARIFLTGGTGFFGIWLLESLFFAKKQLNLQTELVVVSRNPAAFLKKFPAFRDQPGLTWIQAEIQDFPFPEGPFTHVIHAATPASADLNQNHPLLMLDTITQGTRRVLDFAVHAQAEKLLLTSSGAVYGPQPAHMTHIDEHYLGMADPLHPAAAYAGGKWMAEHLAATYAERYQFSVKIARCFAFVGPYLPLDTHFAIGNFMQNVLQKKPIYLHGDGTPHRSYLYAADLMIWLWIILCVGENRRVYNVGSEDAISLGDLAHVLSKYCTPPLDVIIAQAPDTSRSATRYIPSTQRARHELALQQWISLEDGIRKTLDWWRACKNKN